MSWNDAQNAFIGPNNEVKDFLKLHLYDHFPVAVCSPFSGLIQPPRVTICVSDILSPLLFFERNHSEPVILNPSISCHHYTNHFTYIKFILVAR